MSLSYSVARIRITIVLLITLVAHVALAGVPYNAKAGRVEWPALGCFFIDANPVYTLRDPGIRLYQAFESITFEVGFETAIGDEFTAEILSVGAQVPPASNNTGSANSDMNWILNKSYDENGNVVGESKQFFDNGGQPLQSQSKVKYRKNAATTYTHVFASQPVRDALGREALSTMSAPIDNSEFIYKPDFVRNSGGTVYDYRNFDRYNQTDKTNNPDPVGGQVQGTLGWYYSSNNSWEPYTPTTAHPYSRQSFYSDGTGSVKRSAGAGEVFKMGSGHEGSSYVTAVINELNHYLQVRNRFFTATELGEAPATLNYEAMQTISKDANGRLTIAIQDKSGKTLLVGRPGNDLAVSNSATIKGGNLFYFRTFASGSVSVSSANNQLYNMEVAEDQPLGIGTGGNIGAGYYKLVNTGTDDVTVTYGNSYGDLSYSFYNQLGQLIATIAPEGVKKLHGSGLNNYVTKNDVPFIAMYEYDVRGRMVKSFSTEGGTSEVVYRTDGKIRFSQNAEQKTNGRYSYTNYDELGRPIESGEYRPEAGGIPFNSDMSVASAMRNILDNTSSTGGLTNGSQSDVVMTLYDLPNNNHGNTNYVQETAFLGGTISMTRKYSSIVSNAPDNNNLVSATWYSYGGEGNVVWMIEFIKGLGYKTTDYSYDLLGRVVKKVFQKGMAAERFVHYYEYDIVTQNLWKVYTSKTEIISDKKLQATYIYYLHGPLKRIELADDMQGIDYTYTLHGALKAINNRDKTTDPGVDGSNGFNADAFGMVLDYYPGDYENNRTSGIQQITGVNSTGLGADSYAGNIKAMTWFSRKPASELASNPAIEDPASYIYEYDDKYQFTESTWGAVVNVPNAPAAFSATGFNKEKIKLAGNNAPAYDANGNILYLLRTKPTGALENKFTYNYLNTVTNTGSSTDYNTNKLESVVEEAGGSPLTYSRYMYDMLGQLTVEKDGNGAIRKSIKYDVTGKVIMVERNAGEKIVEYVYNEVGKRIIKKSYNTSHLLSQVTYYVGDVIYTQAVTGGTTYGNIVAEEYEVQGASGRLGVYYRQSDIYAYELNDHLGNVRAVVAKSGTTMEVRVYADYYPYGMRIRGADGYRYGYQGQHAEKDDETGWNAFELRMYDSKIARWLSVDPKGEFWSPYVGMGNDPVKSTDPDGGSTTSPIFDINTGVFLGTDSEGYKGDILFMSGDKYNELSKNNAATIEHSIALENSTKITGLSISQNFNAIVNALDHIAKKSMDGNKVYKLEKLYNGLISANFVSENGLVKYSNVSAGIIEDQTGGRTSIVTDMAQTFFENKGKDNEKIIVVYNLNHISIHRTVENVQETFWHEYAGHGLRAYRGSSMHYGAFQVGREYPGFNSITQDYKDHILKLEKGYKGLFNGQYKKPKF